MTNSELTNNINELECLAFSLFKIFAQYEYTIKKMGYLKNKNNNANAEPNWDKFVKNYGNKLIEEKNENEGLHEAIKYIINNPPSKQLVNSGKLIWVSQEPYKLNAHNLFTNIRLIRNNLYHGGKFSTDWFEPQRSKELISSALIVLSRFKEITPEIKAHIDG